MDINNDINRHSSSATNATGSGTTTSASLSNATPDIEYGFSFQSVFPRISPSTWIQNLCRLFSGGIPASARSDNLERRFDDNGHGGVESQADISHADTQAVVSFGSQQSKPSELISAKSTSASSTAADDVVEHLKKLFSESRKANTDTATTQSGPRRLNPNENLLLALPPEILHSQIHSRLPLGVHQKLSVTAKSIYRQLGDLPARIQIIKHAADQIAADLRCPNPGSSVAERMTEDEINRAFDDKVLARHQVNEIMSKRLQAALHRGLHDDNRALLVFTQIKAMIDDPQVKDAVRSQLLAALATSLRDAPLRAVPSVVRMIVGTITMELLLSAIPRVDSKHRGVALEAFGTMSELNHQPYTSIHRTELKQLLAFLREQIDDPSLPKHVSDRARVAFTGLLIEHMKWHPDAELSSEIASHIARLPPALAAPLEARIQKNAPQSP